MMWYRKDRRAEEETVLLSSGIETMHCKGLVHSGLESKRVPISSISNGKSSQSKK